ncbi:hypothetical protein TH25_01610 [Thalassospira profundimaris]|uniref:Glycosyltransferase subfamily 4-like N-terminal domain-containing protein n=1 Tax=Thalassospira profundimaris TaxID=502049 RepID=A0A367XK83_9PROT|nr:glycosyltransferase family 4 protein [Thalassospira profundimaris]RCK54066.1 hypothetical protein TH25_01610 [Thalassospira profundimaris]
MKILFINSLYYPDIGGGLEISLKTLIDALKEENEVVVITTTMGEERIDYVDNVKVYRVQQRNIYNGNYRKKRARIAKIIWHATEGFNIFKNKTIKSIIESENPDIASIHSLSGFGPTLIDILDQSKIPVIQVLHDLYNTCLNSNMFKNSSQCKKQCVTCKVFKHRHKLKSSKITAVLGVSKNILERHKKLGYYKSVPLEFSIQNKRKIEKRIVYTSKNASTFGFIGTINEAKGVELLINEFSKISDESIKLLVAGSGDEGYIENIKRNSPNNIIFIGHTAPDEFFERIDCCIVPSIWPDTLPGVVFESFIYGRPVIGSNRGGIPEMIDNGINGFIFDPQASGDLRHKIETLINDSKKYIELSECAQRKGAHYIKITEWKEKYMSAYQKTISFFSKKI